MHNPSPDRLRVLFELQRTRRWAVSQSTALERSAKLLRLRSALLERRDALADAVHRDFGKSRFEVDLSELHMVVAEIDHTVRELDGWIRPRRVPSGPMVPGSRSEVRFEARGVVLILGPWNYPINLLLLPLVAALAAGNCAIVRPSEKVPHTAEALEDLIAAAFDPSEVACVTGGLEVAEALLDLPFDHIFFTGSTRVGRLVMARAAEHLSSVTLELGGKSPVIVLEDAGLEAAARRIAYGKFFNAGQTCVAPDYVLVPEAHEDAFLEHLRQSIRQMYGSLEPTPDNPDFARMVDRPATERLGRLIAQALEAGAEQVSGGAVDPGAHFVPPTVLRGVRPEMAVMQEEIFGPVLPVLSYRTLEEALSFVSSRPKPLALYAFGQDRARFEQVLARTSAGNTVFNHVFVNMLTPHLPFGGVGESGLGGSYHGFYGFRTFSHERAVLEQHGPDMAALSHPPYNRPGPRLLGKVLRLLER